MAPRPIKRRLFGLVESHVPFHVLLVVVRSNEIINLPLEMLARFKPVIEQALK